MTARKKQVRWTRQADPWRPMIYWTAKHGTVSLIVGHQTSPPGDYAWGVLPKGKKETRGKADTLKEAQQAALVEAQRRTTKPSPRDNPVMRRFRDLDEAKRHAQRYAKRTDQPHYVYRVNKNPRFAVVPGDHPIQQSFEDGLIPLGGARLTYTARPPADNPWEHIGGGCAVGEYAEGQRYPCDDDYEETETGETISVDTTREGHFSLPTRYGGTLPTVAAIEGQRGVKKGSARRWENQPKKRKKKRRKNAAKVISLAAFRRKGKIEEPEIEEPTKEESAKKEPTPEEIREGARRYREMRDRGELWWQMGRPGAPSTPEEVKERMEGMAEASRVKQRIKRLLKVTQGIVSPTTVRQSIEIAKEYDDDFLRKLAFESTEEQWMEKPSFYRAVMRVAADRWGMFKPNPPATKKSPRRRNKQPKKHSGVSQAMQRLLRGT